MRAHAAAYKTSLGLAPGPYLGAYLRSDRYRADFPPGCLLTPVQSADAMGRAAADAGLTRVFLAGDSARLRGVVAQRLARRFGLEVAQIPDSHFPTLALCPGLEKYHVHVPLNCYQVPTAAVVVFGLSPGEYWTDRAP